MPVRSSCVCVTVSQLGNEKNVTRRGGDGDSDLDNESGSADGDGEGKEPQSRGARGGDAVSKSATATTDGCETITLAVGTKRPTRLHKRELRRRLVPKVSVAIDRITPAENRDADSGSDRASGDGETESKNADSPADGDRQRVSASGPSLVDPGRPHVPPPRATRSPATADTVATVQSRSIIAPMPSAATGTGSATAWMALSNDSEPPDRMRTLSDNGVGVPHASGVKLPPLALQVPVTMPAREAVIGRSKLMHKLGRRKIKVTQDPQYGGTLSSLTVLPAS